VELSLLAGLGLGPSLSAQGVTDAAIEGRIVSADSTPVEQAIVHVTNTSTGERWKSTTSARGRYFIEYLSVGGPYRIEVVAIGYQPARRDSIRLALGQRLTAHFTLTPAVLQLEEITVTGPDPRFDPARTGPAQTITDSIIARLPVKRRDYTELALLSPQVTKSPSGGLSFAGQHDRFNSIQIDGTNNNDPFGRAQSGNGTPGWAVGLTAFVPEAVKELQVVSAPFDVRYGGFSGGLINAVTRSGTNQVEGSILGYFENAGLTGTDATGSRASEFSRKELGLTLGGPIVRDRVAAFVTADWREEVIPQSEPVPSTATDAAGYGKLVRFQELLGSHGVEPGSFSAGAFHAPTRKLFVKVTAQLGVGSRLMVSHNYGHGKVRDGTLGRGPGYYPLSSSGAEGPETIHATRLAWTRAVGGRFSNKLILARVGDRRTCLPVSGFPTVSLPADGTDLLAGVLEGCLGLQKGHTLWELIDDFGMVAGNHRLLFGIHGERIAMVDDVVRSPAGHWFFDSLDSLEQGDPARYLRDFPFAGDSQVAFVANQISLYLQDQWLPTPRLTLTAGLRADVPTIPDTPSKHLVAAEAPLRINTALTPSGNVLWSPRLGVNYDLSGRGTTVLRGGAGLFAGHPAYVWFRNVYSSTGARALTIDCRGGAVPAFTLDPGDQPAACADTLPMAPAFTYFDPGFRYPQTLKLAVGADHLLPGGIVGTLDFLYTRSVNSVLAADVNLVGPVATAFGEGGRAIYGTIDPETGEATPARRSGDLRGVYQLRNGGGDRSYSVTVQLQKEFPNGTGLSAAYTHTDAKDRMHMNADIGILNAGSTPVSGTLEDRELRTSFWERAHKVTLAVTTDLPFGFRFGLTYFGMSGAPYTYIVRGDPNADGFPPDFDVSNDVVYLPRDATDITLFDPADYAALDSLIRRESCLRNQRGRLLARNSCRDPWVHETAAQLSKVFPLGGRRALEVTADLFNLWSFLDRDWGEVRATAMDIGNTVPMMELLGWDADQGRGVYRPIPVSRRGIDVEASRWRMQLGATLTF
jgi:hypothetical protein